MEKSTDGSYAYMIDTRIVYGFKGAGKTFYISDCIRNDFFHKYGTTLILCLEQGRERYDTEALYEKRASVAYYDGQKKINEFCSEQIKEHSPDRIYVEMNARYPSAREQFPAVMQVTSVVTWIEWETLDKYLKLFRQKLGQMVMQSQQVTFRGCPSKELLAPYSQEFRLMNHRASYLRQDPMGYHEKAFDLFVPYLLDAKEITITVREYLIFWLDAADHPEHYEGKRLCFTDPLELRKIMDDSPWSAGRVVMTCCMADLQFMSFELIGMDAETFRGGWITMEAIGRVKADEYGRKVLKLDPKHIEKAAAPKTGTVLQSSRNPAGSPVNISSLSYRGNATKKKNR